MESETIGVDIGGTKCYLVRVNHTGKVLEDRHFLSDPKRGVEPLLNDLITHLRALKTKTTTAIGVGIAAQVENGFVSFAPNLYWRNVPLGEQLQEALKLPIVVLNDVHAAAYGEWCCGSGQNLQDLVALFLGTGVGGAVLSQGRWLVGDTGCAAELGHLCIHMHGRACGCGNYGCLESYLGGINLVKHVRERVLQDKKRGKMLLELAHNDINAVSLPLLAQGCRLHDPLSLSCEQQAFDALAAGSISIVHAFNPRALILGGGLLEGFPHWVKQLEEALHKNVLPAAGKRLRVCKAALGTQAGGIGAALYARREVEGAARPKKGT